MIFSAAAGYPLFKLRLIAAVPRKRVLPSESTERPPIKSGAFLHIVLTKTTQYTNFSKAPHLLHIFAIDEMMLPSLQYRTLQRQEFLSRNFHKNRDMIIGHGGIYIAHIIIPLFNMSTYCVDK